MQVMLSLLGIAGAIYITVSFVLFACQRYIIFRPDKKLHPPAHYELPHMQVLTLRTEDDIEITAWYHPRPDFKSPMLLYFHGNTGHIGDRAVKLDAFMRRGMGVLAISYRGFGTSKGKPSEKGFYYDARAAIAFLHAESIPSEKIILYGESLGTGVAVHLATEQHVGGIVLEAPYTSILDRGKARYPYIPVELLLRDKFDSINKIHHIKSRLLIFHGEKDEVIPVNEGRTLLEAAKVDKQGIFFPENGHTDFDAERLAELTYAFAEEVVSPDNHLGAFKDEE